MNLVECTVTKIISGPNSRKDYFYLEVEYDTHGSTNRTIIVRNTNDFSDVVVGYKFLA
jgi:hypothetical protein